MHDLVQEMGLEIVRQECIKEPGVRSRLWNTDEVCRVLKNDAGTAKVEAISLNTSEIREDQINLKPTVFKNMYNLRLLQIFQCLEKRKLHLPQGLDTLPDALRYLNWPAYPLKSLPSSFMPQNLVELDMPSSQLEQLSNEFQHLGNLKVVNLSFSKKLSRMPDLSGGNLKSLYLKDCKSLVEVPSLSFEQVFDKCVGLEKILGTDYFIMTEGYWRPAENELGSSFLWLIPDVFDYSLHLGGCSNLKFLSEMSGNIRHICLRYTAVEELHPSIWSLENLSSLDLNSCKCLKNLPSNIYQLESLEELDLGGCVRIDRFPELPKNLESLPAFSVGVYCKIQVDLSYKSMSKVPDWLCGLSSLPMLDPSGIVTGRRHLSMERLSNMYLFSRAVETNEFIMAGNFIMSLQPCRCAPLDNSNFSKFLYCGCSKLDDREEFSMAIEFLLNVLYDGLFSLRQETVCPSINLCCPGSYVPWWCIYKSMGSSIHLRLADPYWHTEFLGFAFCFVVEFEHYCFDLKHLNYRCEYDLKTNSGESRRFSWSFQRPENAEVVTDLKSINSDHMFMGYLRDDYRDYCDVVEVSFEFFLEQLDSEAFANNGKYKVKRCGIRTLYLQDAEDFGVMEYFS
ncbi:hypothetical protein TIFTF001_018778 [Ficus carica]|uniref:C-JID domain-containing protein n=1 Tax=Ficus carica TaxID=3494 RepID=A0AA88AS89_FICCA|nr:hypothetical protein TIFTF001_018778 [Ficus carica]